MTATTLETEDLDYRPSYRAAAIAAAAVFVLYLITLSPSTAMWDTSEYIATAHILGIPHPPGNPLFVLLARTADILLAPLGLSTAVRINSTPGSADQTPVQTDWAFQPAERDKATGRTPENGCSCAGANRCFASLDFNYCIAADGHRVYVQRFWGR